MKTKARGSFLHTVKKIKDPDIKETVERAIKSVENAKMINDIPNLIKMEGFKIFYRIRVGNYRISIMIENNIATFLLFANRKDFYKVFPSRYKKRGLGI
jgi:mRNA interferase RelE/StbE